MCPALYFDPLVRLRVKFLEVAIVVRKVDGNAILQQRNAPHMITAADAGAANRKAHLLPKTRLRINAGREGQCITQRHCDLVLEGIRTRSEERRVGKECVGTVRSRWST